jgi:hypothetical protein
MWGKNLDKLEIRFRVRRVDQFHRSRNLNFIILGGLEKGKKKAATTPLLSAAHPP